MYLPPKKKVKNIPTEKSVTTYNTNHNDKKNDDNKYCIVIYIYIYQRLQQWGY